MKFKNPSFKYFWNGQTDARTSRNQYAPNFFKVGDINMQEVSQRKASGTYKDYEHVTYSHIYI